MFSRGADITFSALASRPGYVRRTVPKRHLPVLPSQGSPDEPPRPPWQWVGLGAGAIFAVWLPLSVLVGALAGRLLAHAVDEEAQRRAAIALSVGYAFELAGGALAGGYLVGRWGPRNVGVREAMLSGLLAAGVGALAVMLSPGPSFGAPLLAVIAPAAAGLGAKLGLRGRPNPGT
jgi:peptidoglycan/LPS O-acetylase OafA/YrhL